MSSSAESYYRSRRDECVAAEQTYSRRDQWLTHLRTITFLVSAALCLIGWSRDHQRLWYVLGGLVFLGLLALARYHELITAALGRHRMLRRVHEWSLARLRRDWSSLPEPSVEIPAEHRATAQDLDLFGHASLFQWVCRASTPLGKIELRDWLLESARPEDIRHRQDAVRELAPQRELREKLALEGGLLPDRGDAIKRFIEWAESPPWLTARPWLVIVVRTSPGLILLIGLLALAGILPSLQALVAVLVVVAFQFFLLTLFVGQIHEIFALLGVRTGAVRPYLTMFELLDSLPDSDSELGRLKREASEQGGGVLRRMRQLRVFATLAGIQHSALMFIFVYLPLQFLMLYDFHVLSALEHWQRRYGRFARSWFTALGRFEAISSLAALHDDYPEWAFPEVNRSADRFTADQLGHPLLPDSLRVTNDLEIGPVGCFLLVTGSNMSGKSTLLRSAGMNAVLAQAGSPVCARRLVMPPVILGTSMRVQDSLENGVSFYMAELMRLKQIVDLAADAARRDGRLLLYLLDEILLGTNSRERHIAIVHVMEFLLQQPAIGAISTHDLELATDTSLSQKIQCVHFRETLHGQDAERPMTFDYRMRPGVATTTNALKLLELVGLPSGQTTDTTD